MSAAAVVSAPHPPAARAAEAVLEQHAAGCGFCTVALRSCAMGMPATWDMCQDGKALLREILGALTGAPVSQ